MRDGDVVTVCGHSGGLTVEGVELEDRAAAVLPARRTEGMGRELFEGFRQIATSAEDGALCMPDLAVPATEKALTEA